MPIEDELAGLARACREEAARTSHPPTARTLRELAGRYEDEAKRVRRD